MSQKRKWWAPSGGFCFYGLKWLLLWLLLCVMRKKPTSSKGFQIVTGSILTTVESQCEEVTNCSDRIPVNSMTLGNKTPSRAVCQLCIFRAVCALFIESDSYMDGQANKNTWLAADSFLQLEEVYVVCWCACVCVTLWRRSEAATFKGL